MRAEFRREERACELTPATILVVEDEPVIAYDLRQTLGQLGYTVPTTVATGKHAIDAAGRLRPQLVLMDIKLKGEMDGVTAAGAIRDRFAIPVVYLTSFAGDATLARAAETRPHGYLVKPFCDRDLRVVIELALKRHAVERRQEQEQEQERRVALRELDDDRPTIPAPDLRADAAVVCRSILSTEPGEVETFAPPSSTFRVVLPAPPPPSADAAKPAPREPS